MRQLHPLRICSVLPEQIQVEKNRETGSFLLPKIRKEGIGWLDRFRVSPLGSALNKAFAGRGAAGDDVALWVSARQCTRNSRKETKYGFYQYSAAWDSKHIVFLRQGKSAQLLYLIQEMDDGNIAYI